MSRSISIVSVEDDSSSWYNVIVDGEWVCEKLCWDELLGRLALVIVPKQEPQSSDMLVKFGFKKLESYWEMEKRLREKIISELRPCDRELLKQRSSI